MNILYEKTKLLGRPMRTAEDEWWSQLSGKDWTALTDQIWGAVNISGVEGTGDQTAAEQSLYEYLNAGAASKEEQDAINKAISAAGGIGSLKLSDIPQSLWNTIKSVFTKPDGSIDWSKAGMAGGALLGMSGLGRAETGGYKGTIPNLTAVRERIDYTDPNRRPGSSGRQYFTPTQYVPASGVDAARTAAKAQAAGILSGYKATEAPKASTFNMATPWEKPAAAPTTTTTTTPADASTTPAALPQIPNAAEIAKATYPEKTVLAKGGPAMREPRYLRGITDGMEDKLQTSIDGKQPALLSHGEFVIPADVVSHLGNGNSDAGARKLYQMMDRIRQDRTGTKKQGKRIDPDKYMPGGSVGYDRGGIVAFQAGGSSGTTTPTTTTSNLSPYVGDYVTTALGEAQAAAAQPYEAYKGPLTAGASDLQTKAFTGAEQLATTGYTPGAFTTGTFDTEQAAKYMNPYISQALDPQLKELRRQAQISNLGSIAKAGSAGALSSAGRQLMESENMRNLLGKQADVLGTGYATAFDKAMQQFNTEQGRQMEAQKAGEESRQFGATFGRNTLKDLADLGKTQRDIEAEGIAADLAEFEKQRDYELKMPQYKIGLLQKLPVEAEVREPATNTLTEMLQSGGTLVSLLKGMGLIK